MPIKEGNISPLRNVIAFARSAEHVAAAGLWGQRIEGGRERLATTQQAFLFDAMRIREARDLDIPDYDPSGSAMESQW